MLVDFFLNLFLFLDLNPWLFYCGVFLFAFLESIAVVGLFLPGTSVLTFVGLMSFYDYGNSNLLVITSLLGAWLGDICSYWLGTKGTKFFRYEARLLKLAHLDRSCAFFNKHGLLGLLAGRFIGPMRPLVPFVAGLSGLGFKVFVRWSLYSSILWAGFTIYSGFVFAIWADLYDLSRATVIYSFLILLFVLFLIFPMFVCWVKILRKKKNV